MIALGFFLKNSRSATTALQLDAPGLGASATATLFSLSFSRLGSVGSAEVVGQLDAGPAAAGRKFVRAAATLFFYSLSQAE
jgi:hypothetical protein